MAHRSTHYLDRRRDDGGVVSACQMATTHRRGLRPGNLLHGKKGPCQTCHRVLVNQSRKGNQQAQDALRKLHGIKKKETKHPHNPAG